MLTHTWDDDGSRARALAELPHRETIDAGRAWQWTCDCGAVVREDEAQHDGILTCPECDRRYVDSPEESPQ